MAMGEESQQIVVSLTISAQEYLSYYRGAASAVVARSRDGKTVRFPAGLLRRFLTHEGVHGEFVLRYDARNKFVSIDRC
jgi:hypothetical protein